MRAVSTVWANAVETANVAASATATGKERCFSCFMGTSSGFVFYARSLHCWAPLRAIACRAITPCSVPYNSDVVFIKCPQLRPRNDARRCRLVPNECRHFVAFLTLTEPVGRRRTRSWTRLRAAAWDVGLANAMAAQDNPVIYPIQRSGWPVV